VRDFRDPEFGVHIPEQMPDAFLMIGPNCASVDGLLMSCEISHPNIAPSQNMMMGHAAPPHRQ
jgi:hypothetical protein